MARTLPVRELRKLRLFMVLLCLIGIGLSALSLYVEVAKKADGNYQAICDISSYISCSKVFTSKYGRGFGIVGEYLGKDHILNQPNSIAGIIFYVLVLILGEIKSVTSAKVQKGVVFLSNFMSLYLAYILYFVLHDFCVVCVSTYVVNLLLTWCTFRKVSFLQNYKRKAK